MKTSIFKTSTPKRKSLAFAIALTLALTAFAAAPAYAANDISIYVDGIKLQTDVPPMIISDRTMVPVRAVTEAVGCKVDWFGGDQRIVIYSPAGGDPLLVMYVGDKSVTLNHYNGDTGAITGEVLTIDAPPVIVNNRTLVPLRFIAETIGFEVGWDGGTQTVFLYSALYEGGDMADWNGFDFDPNLEYAEEYKLEGDSGDYLPAWEAAKLTFDAMRDNGHIPGYINGMEYTMTLVDLTDIEGEECYVFTLDWGSDTAGAAYAYAYRSGNIYMQGQMGIWVMSE